MKNSMRNSSYPYDFSKGQRRLSTLANVNSAVGHTAGVFGGITVGANIKKMMDENGVNSGISLATGILSAIAVSAAASLITEKASGTMRKKAGVSNPFTMLCDQNEFEYEEEDYDDMPEDDQVDDSILEDDQEPEHEHDD